MMFAWIDKVFIRSCRALNNTSFGAFFGPNMFIFWAKGLKDPWNFYRHIVSKTALHHSNHIQTAQSVSNTWPILTKKVPKEAWFDRLESKAHSKNERTDWGYFIPGGKSIPSAQITWLLHGPLHAMLQIIIIILMIILKALDFTFQTNRSKIRGAEKSWHYLSTWLE